MQAQRRLPAARARREAAEQRRPGLRGLSRWACWARTALLLGLVLSGCGAVVAAVGARTDRPALVEIARRIAFAVLATMLVVNGAMLAALLSDDFMLRYVADNSSRETPVFFKVLSLWAADDGSLLFWNLILAGYIAAVAMRFRRYRPPTFPYALTVLFARAGLLPDPGQRSGAAVRHAGPAAADGRGPAPLLQNHPLMAVHPPFLYLGFIGFTVPFAFGVAALLAGSGSDALGLDHPALDAGGLVLPHRRAGARRAVVVLGARLGRLLGLGPGGERRAAALAGRPPPSCTRSCCRSGAAWPAVEHRAGHRGVRAHDLRHVPDPGQRAVLGARVRAVRGRAGVPGLPRRSCCSAGFGLVAWRLPTAAHAGAAGVDGVPRGGVRRQQHAAAGRDRDHPARHGAPARRRGRHRSTRSPSAARTSAVRSRRSSCSCCCSPAPRRCCPGGRPTGSGRSPAAGAGRAPPRSSSSAPRRPGCATSTRSPGSARPRSCWSPNGQEIASGLVTGRRAAGAAACLRTLVRGRRRYAGLTVHVGLALLASGITASSNLGRADPGHAAHRAEHRVRRPHPALRRAGDRPAAAAHRAHRPGGRQRQRAR